jgi:exopolysaccharide production protein ExoZ
VRDNKNMTERSKPGPRLVNLQILRAVAATLAVWAHAVDVSLLPGNGKPLLASGYFENFGAFGVDMFFVISGFIISASARKPGRTWVQFAEDRYIRIAPIYYVLSLPWILRVVPLPDVSWAPLIPNFLFWPIVDGRFVEPFLSVGWTLCFEALFYAVMTAALALWPRIGRPVLAAAAVLLALVCLRPLVDTPILTFLGNPIILEFLFGIVISWICARTTPDRRIAFALATVVFLAICCELIYGFGDISESQLIESGERSFARVLLWGLPAAGIVYVALVVEGSAVELGPVRRLLAFLGDASYSIYLVHLLVMVVCKALQAHGFLSGDLLIVGAIACSLVAGSLSYLFIERPLIRAIRRMLRGRTQYKTAAPSSPL